MKAMTIDSKLLRVMTIGFVVLFLTTHLAKPSPPPPPSPASRQAMRLEHPVGGAPSPANPGTAGTNGEDPGPVLPRSYAPGTLWLEIVGISNNLVNLVVHGTVPDTPYEILAKESLANSDWAGATPIVVGAAGQDWTLTTVSLNTPTNQLYLWARSWVDADGDGLPDWWELSYGLDPSTADSGNTGIGDGYKDGDHDGWNNLQEYDNRTSPAQFNAPAPLHGLAVTLDASGTNASLTWLPASLPVLSYTIERSYPYDTFEVANATSVVISLGDTLPELFLDMDLPYFRIQVHYANGSSAWSEWKTITELAAPAAVIRSGIGDSAMLIVQAMPAYVAAVRVGAAGFDWNNYEHYSVASLVIPRPQFANGIATVPLAFAQAAASNHLELYTQYVLTNSGSLGSAINLNGYVDSFWDGRAQLKDNLRFLLRSATPFDSFGFVRRDGNSLTYRRADSPQNYAYAGFYDVGEYLATDDPNLHPFAYIRPLLPFEDNHLYRNFAFDAANLDAFGNVDTGVYWDSGAYNNLYLLTPERWVFQPPATGGAVPSVLSAGESQWTVWLDDYRSVGSLPGNNVGVTLQNDEYQMAPGARNIFGLPYLSFQLTWGNAPTDRAILAPGYPLASDGLYGLAYPETAQPSFQIVDYYFARQYGDWYFDLKAAKLPGHSAFSPADPNPLLITSVGSAGRTPPFRLAGYAKLAVTNGYPGVYGYLGQYFDRAYKTSNGVVTTNETGILSPYGDFFPTEPGRTALVTMPDLDTGARGTATVYVVKLELDVNHDGTIDRTFAGPDNTSAFHPFVFWVNNDYEPFGMDLEGGNDFDDGKITSVRDLEDFARLWISGLPALPASGDYSASLSWRDTRGEPKIKIYPAAEVDGGIGYLTNAAVAFNQLTILVGQPCPGQTLGEIAPGQPLAFPADYFAQTGRKHFLFEGSGIGAGELVLTIAQGTNTLVETSVWLDLHDVKDFYERVVITNNYRGGVANWGSGIHVVENQQTSQAGDDPNFVAFVHGINVSVTDWLHEADTIWKRLYWSGYLGKFAAVKWDCNFLTPPNKWDPSIFNLSELKAYKASQGIKAYMEQLQARLPGDRFHLLVHSQGNAVVSEALKQGAPSFDTYVLTQSAIPASAYDISAPTNADLAAREYSPYLTPDWQPMGYHGTYTNLTGRIVNFVNPQDSVLNIWLFNQRWIKPSEFYSFDGDRAWYLVDGDLGLFRVVADSQESRAMVSRSRTLPIGMQLAVLGQPVQGVISSTVNLNSQFGFNNEISEHSAQWARPIQTSRSYYIRVLNSIQP